jgi:type I restriction-modification system DNA methylase subunit
MAKQRSNKSSNGATVGYEQQLWQMADALRGSMDAAEYKHVVLGLIFLKYISDAFEEQHAKLEGERAQGADPEDPDEYRALNIFWVPPEARWSHLKTQAKQSTIGELVDTAMTGIERDNPSLKGVLPKDYARPALDKTRLGQLIDLISNIHFGSDQPSPPTPLPVGEGRGEGEPGARLRDRRGEVLFVDARKMGRLVDRTHRELTDDEIPRIANAYHAWRGEKDAGDYADTPGFCKSATLDEIRKHGHVLTPGRYVGAEAQEDDGEPFDQKMQRLTATLREQQVEGAKLDIAIAASLKELGYGG